MVFISEDSLVTITVSHLLKQTPHKEGHVSILSCCSSSCYCGISFLALGPVLLYLPSRCSCPSSPFLRISGLEDSHPMQESCQHQPSWVEAQSLFIHLPCGELTPSSGFLIWIQLWPVAAGSAIWGPRPVRLLLFLGHLLQMCADSGLVFFSFQENFLSVSVHSQHHCWSVWKSDPLPPVHIPVWKVKVLITQFSSVAQSCPTLCNPMNRSTPGLPVHHQLLEFTQTHVHRVLGAQTSSQSNSHIHTWPQEKP